MAVEIRYCQMCGGDADARRVEKEICKHLPSEVKLVDVGRGIFEVTDNGRVVFSKSIEGRFPRSMEIVRRLRGLNK